MESPMPSSNGGLSPRSFAIQHQRPRISFTGCSRITDYEVLGKLGEGTFGEVHRARSRKTNALVALKKIIMHNEKDGVGQTQFIARRPCQAMRDDPRPLEADDNLQFPITALREIKLLKLLSHDNILRLEDMAVEHPPRSNDVKRKRPIMYMVTPYMDHDLSGLLNNPSVTFTEPQIKCYMLQLLEGLRYLHDQHILHRDMKAANLLINNKGILQIADFGLARHYDGPTPKAGQGGGDGKREYTGLVVTRWYRPPELLLHLKKYTTAIDVWGVGCVFGEMLTGKPILSGDSDGHQLDIIWDLVGSPTPQNMPLWSTLPGSEGLQPRSRPGNLSTRFREHGSAAISLLKELLKLDWKTRINAIDALQHSYFKMSPLPAKAHELPTFEESHEFDRRKFHDRKAALPPAPKGGTVGMGPEAHGASAGFNTGDGYASGRNGVNGGRHPHRNGDERRPAWARDRPMPGERGLPPRPPPPVDSGDDRGGYRDRNGGRGPRNPRPPGADVDTYVPSYGREGGRHRDDRPRDDRPPLDQPRDDRPPLDRRRRNSRDDWRSDRGPDRAPQYGSRERHTRSRSRSPVRDRERERDYRR
ncbi:hypothetical protein BN1723_017551, partial [Verticillium longisporum]